MAYLLDSNTCITHLRSRGRHSISNRLRSASPGTIFIATIVEAELLFGALRSADPARNLAEVRHFCGQLKMLAFDSDVAEEHARVRSELASRGTPIGPYDSIIAATALVHQLTVVTHNTAEFNRVAGLSIEDWE